MSDRNDYKGKTMEVEVNPSHDTVDQWEAAVGGLGDGDSKN